MGNIKELYKRLFEEKVSVLAGRPMAGKTPLLTDMLIEYGIEQKKKITIYTIDDHVEDFFTINVLASLMNIPKSLLRKYIYPLKNIYRESDTTLSPEEYLANLEKLATSPIEVVNYDSNMISNPADFILENEKDYSSDIIIILTMETFIKNSESPRQFLKTMQNVNPKTKILMTCGVEREVEGTHVQNFEDIHNYHELSSITSAIALFELPTTPDSDRIHHTRVHLQNEEYTFDYDRETNRIGE